MTEDRLVEILNNLENGLYSDEATIKELLEYIRQLRKYG